jgi:ribosomal protein S18 acetylase RimI-like enzyme
MQFIQATLADLDKIIVLAHKIWNDHYPEIIGQEQVDYMLKKMYDAESLKQQILNNDLFFIAYTNENEAPSAFISIKEVENGSFFIHKFYVNTQIQRSGVGRAFFEFVVKNFNPEVIRLQVNRMNYKAINFYFKNGFTIEKVADFDIGDGYFMNDFVMIWESIR